MDESHISNKGQHDTVSSNEKKVTQMKIIQIQGNGVRTNSGNIKYLFSLTNQNGPSRKQYLALFEFWEITEFDHSDKLKNVLIIN